MKRFLIPAAAFLLFGCLLLCSACAAEAHETRTIAEPAPFTGADPVCPGITELPVITVPVTELQTLADTAPVHEHLFRVVSRAEPTCAQEGSEILTCECGETKARTLKKAAHSYSPATCSEPEICSVCGARGAAALGHEIEGEACLRCGASFPDPIYVLGQGLDFNASRAEVMTKLGPPTETLTEGNLVSLVYAADYKRFTVVQTDEEGVWGVFTVDPSSFCRVDGVNRSLASFAARYDAGCDVREEKGNGIATTAFCDSASGGKNWAIWSRLAEVSYHYALNGTISQNYDAQAKLCWYLTNAIRAANGLQALVYSPQASAVAREYSACMVETGVFDHDDSYKARLTEKGVTWRWVGENISEGFDNVFSVVNAYYNSASHRANLLSRNFTHLGTGFALSDGEQRVVYGAQEFYSLH